MTWQELGRAFERTLDRPDVARWWATARTDQPSVVRFGSIHDMVAFLRSSEHAPDDRNSVYSTLIRMARSSSAAKTTIDSALFVALWPGLTAIYGRLARRSGDSDLVVSELSCAFVQELARVSVTNVRRVAVTLLRNSEREASAALFPESAWCESPTSPPKLRRLSESAVTGSYEMADPDDVIAARAALAAPEADLLADTANAENQARAAERLGISHAAYRKRLERARKRLRDQVETGSETT